jgi:integrase
MCLFITPLKGGSVVAFSFPDNAAKSGHEGNNTSEKEDHMVIDANTISERIVGIQQASLITGLPVSSIRRGIRQGIYPAFQLSDNGKYFLSIGHIRIGRLQPHHLTKFYNNLAESGVRGDAKYNVNPRYIDQIKNQKKTLTVKANIHEDTMNNLLKGGNITQATANKISLALDIPLEKLYTKANGHEKLNSETVLHHHRFISSVLNKAVKWNVIMVNPVQRAEVPKARHRKPESYDDNQVIQMLEFLQIEPLKHRSAVYIAVYGGLRLGEVVGLRWDDIDFEKKTVSISKERQYLPEYGIYEKCPKTDESIRSFTLSDGALTVLAEYKQEQEAAKQKLGNIWQETGFIFVQWNGLPEFPSTPSQWFRKWMKRTNLPKISFHKLRHSCASILIANHVDIASVSNQLGHAQLSTTLNMYTHPLKSKETVAANTLDEVLTRRTKKGSIEPK